MSRLKDSQSCEDQAAVGARLTLLQDAFQLFDQAAGSLADSYRTLTARVQQLDVELAERNEELQRNLQEKEAMRRQLAAILHSLSTGVIVTDEDDLILRINEAAERLLGIPREHLLGQKLAGCLRAAGLGNPDQPFAAPNGIPLVYSRARLQESGNHVNGTIALLHDVSEIRRLEERIQRRDRLAAMGEMVGRIAHEIRNPLGSVELFASMLRQDLMDDPEHRQYAEHISVAVQAMDRLLCNLLAYTKPRAPQLAWHAPHALIAETVAMAEHALRRQRVTVKQRLDPAVGMLRCDAGQLRQALLNLVLNAVQAMPQGGELTVTVSQQTNPEAGRAWVRIAVRDTGGGIDPANLSRIFDPFFTTREEGTGLGLAIVHGIVDAHKGRVEVDSHPGEGSTFTIILPLVGREGTLERDRAVVTQPRVLKIC
jgi:two-component system sensor histidine kinase FlrB